MPSMNHPPGAITLETISIRVRVCSRQSVAVASATLTETVTLGL